MPQPNKGKKNLKNITKEQCKIEFERLAAQNVTGGNGVPRAYWQKNHNGISDRQIRNIFGTWTNFINYIKTGNEKVSESSLDFNEKYVYNSDSDKFIFLLNNKIGKDLVISGEKIRSITKSYSNYFGEEESLNQLAIKYNIPRQYLTHICKALNLTHDSLPVTDEELIEKGEAKVAEELLQDKKFRLYQKLEKEDWIDTKNAAEKWNNLQRGILEPIKEYVESIEKIEPMGEIKLSKNIKGEKIMVLSVNDIHIGSKADGRFLTFGQEWNSELALKAIETFVSRAIKVGKEEGVKSIILCALGDNHHGFKGHTAKNTILKCDLLEQDQLDCTIKAFRIIIDGLLKNFQSVNLQALNGNHDSTIEFYSIFKLIEQIYKDNPRFSIKIWLKDYLHFQVGGHLFIGTHGAAETIKWKFPQDHKGRKELGIRLIRIVEKEGNYKDIKRIFLTMGDLHAFQAIDYGQFTYYLFGALPLGDEYANALGLEGTPCQNALILENGEMDYKTVHITTKINIS